MVDSREWLKHGAGEGAENYTLIYRQQAEREERGRKRKRNRKREILWALQEPFEI